MTEGDICGDSVTKGRTTFVCMMVHRSNSERSRHYYTKVEQESEEKAHA